MTRQPRPGTDRKAPGVRFEGTADLASGDCLKAFACGRCDDLFACRQVNKISHPLQLSQYLVRALTTQRKSPLVMPRISIKPIRRSLPFTIPPVLHVVHVAIVFRIIRDVTLHRHHLPDRGTTLLGLRIFVVTQLFAAGLFSPVFLNPGAPAAVDRPPLAVTAVLGFGRERPGAHLVGDAEVAVHAADLRVENGAQASAQARGGRVFPVGPFAWWLGELGFDKGGEMEEDEYNVE